MARAWIVDGPGIAMKVKNASVSKGSYYKDCGAYIECPNCTHRIDNTNVLMPWPGLPKGVKFEPTDEEIIEHLEAKCGIDGLEPHVLLEEFIRPVTEDVGINYTHPENLPGANKDGVSIFFFHKTVQAYGTGQRKRRRITPTGLNDEPVRWHKTGRTKPVMLNGVQKGCKKIMVLYKSARKGSKPEKSNWVLHQYHLGTEGNDIGEYVISKISYQQQKHGEKNVGEEEVPEEGEHSRAHGSPRTPNTKTPTPPRPVNTISGVGEAFDATKMLDPLVQGLENIPEASSESTWSAGAVEDSNMNRIEDNLKCKEHIEDNPTSGVENANLFGELELESGNFAISDLENADLGSPPEFLSLASQDSLLNWLGWL
ncbi:PREDICTED: NAC domain-containing protein 8-like [Tarenaya hassleriana]|uniref:NAC domain-containing protein 8-like n=1 Tax=Tarenaya hassleriana TaxID=28532 RepID=UPI0008FD0EA6|nr:PREDICTED: NAC domain-containing protein 8-like [Tarenaya hassleriana]